jgi:methanogenic corrinoid protein MtbC1
MTEERMLLDKLYNAIANCDDEESIEVTKKAIEKNVDPTRLIDTALKAIEKVGNDFEKELIFLPELMLAGYGTEKVMSMIQKKMMEEGLVPETRGKLVMGTVQGDLHNIGKDLVITMWRAKGFQVYDLGINVAASRIISVAEDFNADIVGISAHLGSDDNHSGGTKISDRKI